MEGPAEFHWSLKLLNNILMIFKLDHISMGMRPWLMEVHWELQTWVLRLESSNYISMMGLRRILNVWYHHKMKLLMKNCCSIKTLNMVIGQWFIWVLQKNKSRLTCFMEINLLNLTQVKILPSGKTFTTKVLTTLPLIPMLF